jgi:hypothetical protein
LIELWWRPVLSVSAFFNKAFVSTKLTALQGILHFSMLAAILIFDGADDSWRPFAESVVI